MTNINYMQTIPNSHYWTNLNQILQHVIYIETGVDIEDLTPEYLLIGLNNSMKHGYKLKRIEETLSTNHPNFINLNEVIEYIKTPHYVQDNLIQAIKNTLNNGFNLTNGLKMERQDVYKRINAERDYQDMRWNTNLRADDVPDEEKPVSEWLNYIEYHLSKAKNENYHHNKKAALAEVRKVAALAVRCLEIHGCPERITVISYNNIENYCCDDKNCDCK
jgi:hypothetical protein